MKELFHLLMDDKKRAIKVYISAACLLVALFFPKICTLFDSGLYYLNVVNYIFVYVIAATGLNVMTGYSGQINLGGAAYFAVGAYGVVVLQNLGVPLFLAVILGMGLVALFGFLTAVPAAKLKFHFLALATMAVGEIINNLLVVSPGGITNDTHGIYVNAMKIFGIKLKSDTQLFYLLLLSTVLVIVFTWLFINSRTGRACIATRDNVDAATSCGIDVKKYKIIATVVSCVIIGFAGFLFAYLNRYISPDTFSAGKSTMLMSMMMLGGSGTILGPVLGAILVTIIMEGLRNVPSVGIYFQLAYGVILLLVMMFMPDGLYGEMGKIKKRAKAKEAGGETDA